MSNIDRRIQVFLCYAPKDISLVRELYKRLLMEGWIDPWFDEEKLLPGMDRDSEIEKVVESADFVLICLSNNSINEEGYFQKELRKVLDISLEKPEGTIYIIPFRIQAVSPPHALLAYKYVDYFSRDLQELGYLDLLRSLMTKSNLDEFRKKAIIQALNLEESRRRSSDFTEFKDFFEGFEKAFKELSKLDSDPGE